MNRRIGMRWRMRRRVRALALNSMWPVPTMALALGLVTSPLVRWFDDATRWHLLGYTPEGARAILAALTPAAMTLIALVLSTLLLVVQLASSQFSPRLIAGIMARWQVKLCLSAFVFSYAYCAGVAGRVGDRVPQLPVVVAIGTTLLSIGAGLFLIDFMARELRPVCLLARSAEVGLGVIRSVYPQSIGADDDDGSGTALSPLSAPYQTVLAHHAGVLLAMDEATLLGLAVEHDRTIELVPQIGEFVSRGQPLFRVHPDLGAVDPEKLQASVAFGDERTPEQDPQFVFRILVDVAAKALSPAVNDPTTAKLALDQIHRLLRDVGQRRLDTGQVRDRQGALRLSYRTPDWDDFVLLAVSEIRQYGGGSLQVARRLKAMLKDLSSEVPRCRRATLDEQVRLLRQALEREFVSPEDLARADVGDYQGVGGSPGGDGTTAS